MRDLDVEGQKFEGTSTNKTSAINFAVSDTKLNLIKLYVILVAKCFFRWISVETCDVHSELS